VGRREPGAPSQLLDAGTLKVPVQDTYDLQRAGEALQALGTTHTQGKLAIRIA
jgi:NADPH:quinone reductase-like Zn-dependent oxidoreductase